MLFQQLKNIDTAFQYVRLLSLAVIVCSALVCSYTVYQSYQMVRSIQGKIYVLVNGQALEAVATERKQNIAVEARDHIKMFHHYFFTLDPDEKMIQNGIRKALYLADGSAKRQYDNLKENRYYSNLISGNITQEIQMDSIQVDIRAYPYRFIYYGHQKIIRTTSILYRNLITEGVLRTTFDQTDNNPHGFMIERWTTRENNNMKIENR